MHMASWRHLIIAQPSMLRGLLKLPLTARQIERNLQDAMCVARNVCKDPRLVPGGGAVEMAVSRALTEGADAVGGVEAGPYRAVGSALEVIPRTLAQNCGANVIRTLTELRGVHGKQRRCTFGIDGNSGATGA